MWCVVACQGQHMSMSRLMCHITLMCIACLEFSWIYIHKKNNMFSVECGYPCHLFLGDWLFHSGRRLLPLINVTRYTLVALWSWPWTDCSDGSKDIYCSVWWVKQPVLWLMWQIIHVTSDTCGALCLWPWDQVGFHDLNRAAAVSFPHVVLHQIQVSEWVN